MIEPAAAWTPDTLSAWLSVVLAPGLGGVKQRRLMARFGLPQCVLDAPFAHVAEEVGEKTARALFEFDPQPALEKTQNWLLRPHHHLLSLDSPHYPPALLTTSDPPSLLWVKGHVQALHTRALAMVGSRTPTRHGVENARAFARHLAREGLVIISGLASGIDTAAHEGALDAPGQTVAVMGTGVDRVYPASNHALARQILETGALVSEFPLGTDVHPGLFPRRNRIIAGLSCGVLVVEAARKSGSLITARLAVEEGRDVFAIPGSIHSPLSRGCHQLIREGARLVECGQDIFDELDGPKPDPSHTLPASSSGRRTPKARPGAQPSDAPPAAPGKTPSPPQPLGAMADTLTAPEVPELCAVWARLAGGPVALETVLEQTGLTVEALYAILLELELDGWVERLPGNHFQQRIPGRAP